MVMTVSKFFSVKMKKKLVKTCLFQNKYLSLQRTKASRKRFGNNSLS